ncbi:MAG: AsmA family protein, partial [Ectothiorhodospiraceae bacterium]
MGRVVKWLLIGLAGVLGLIVVFVAAVLLIVDPNDYRDDITRVVQQQTGRELTIQGDLGLSFFPWFGIEAGGIRLADAPAFGDEPILQVKNVTLAVKVMPLLSGNLVVDTIVLDRPQLHLVRDAKGNANWEALGKGKPQARLQREARVVPVAMAASGDGQAGPAVPEIVRTAALAGVRVRQASIRYEDLGAGTKARVDPLNLELQNIQLGEPIQVEADWQAALDGGPAVQGQLSTEATVARDLSKAQAKDVSLDVTASGDAIPAGKQEASLRAQVEADLKQGLYRITGIRLDAAGIAATGQAETRMSKQGPITTGMLEIPPTSPRDIMDQLAVEVPKTRDSDALQNLEGSVTFRVVGSRVELKPLRLALDKSTLNGEATIRDFAGPAADFDLALDNIDVDRYLPPPSETEEKSGEEPAKGEKKPTPLPVDMLRGL